MSDIPDLDDRNKILDDSINNKIDLSNKFCEHPFDNFEPHSDGSVATCCMSWLPYLIGNINDQSPDSIYNSQKAQDIRRSILDGSFKYCDHRVCPRIQNRSLPNKDEITNERHRDIIDNNKVIMDYPIKINCLYDPSCNLSCPSCRVEKISFIKGEQYEYRLKIHNNLINFILKKDLVDGCTFNITGSGDPCGAKIFRDFLLNFDGDKHPEITIDLQTNGVMLTPKMWNSIHRIHKNIGLIMVSFDAALPSTYSKVRKGGDWEILINNIKNLCQQRPEYIKRLRLDFVVQDSNYKEMPKFVTLGKSFGCVDMVCFSMITNWVWTDEAFKEKAIWHKDHPDFEDFMSVLRSEELKDQNFVDMSNLHSYYLEANK